MKIFEINVDCGAGGSTGRIVSELAHGLQDRGHEVRVAYGRDVKKDDTIPLIKVGSKLGIYWHVFLSRFLDAHGLGSGLATRKLVRQLRSFDPDVIHLHNIHGYYLNYPILFRYLKRANKRVVWTLHDCWAFTGHSAYCEASDCEKWRTGCKNCPRLDDYPKSALDFTRRNWFLKKQVFSGVRDLTIVTPSAWLAGLVKESFLQEYSTVVINNGVDTEVFKPCESDFRKRNSIENKIMILAVASLWNQRKGLEDYKKLCEKLDDRFQLVMVGLSREQISRLPRKIIGIERTESPQKLAELYSTADVFLNLTYEDNYPTVNLEAQCCGTGVVTYGSGGSGESAGEAGIVISTGNIQQVVDTLEHLDICSFKEKNAAANALQRYDKKAVLSRYISLFKSEGNL